MDPVGAGAAVGDGVDAHDALGVLDGLVDLAGRDAEALGHQLEVVDERLHRGAHDLADVLEGLALAVGGDGHLGGPGDRRVGDHVAVGRVVAAGGDLVEAVEGLGDDLEGLVALVEAYAQTVVAVGAVVDRDVEVVGLVAAVGTGLAQVERVAGGLDAGAGEAQGHARGEGDLADSDEARLEERVLEQQLAELLDVVLDVRHDGADELAELGRDVLGEAAGADVGVVHAQAGDHLEGAQDVLAAAEGDRHEGRAAELVAAGADRDDVRGDAVELHEDDAHDGGLLGHVVGDAEELLDGEGVADLLEEGGHVVHTGHEGLALGPGAVLHVLLDARVEVAGAHADLGDLLSVGLEDEAEDAVGGGVDGPHVDDDAVVLEAVLLVARGDLGRDLVPVAALGGPLRGALGERVGGGAGGVELGAAGGAHQRYDLRVSAGGVVAPLYSTGMPPSG